jgi:serine/threonine-protein kinase
MTTAVDPLFLSFQEAVAGRYSLERELGRGGMGVVYLAREVRLDRQVAIKLLPPELATQAQLRDRFMREARTAARLSHPYIVPIHSVDEITHPPAASAAEGTRFVFYVMAYVDGDTLGQRVSSRGPLPPHEVTRILREVAWALAYAHAQGVVHRDIKPANILLERGTQRAMVTDFGIARVTQSGGETAIGEVLGTPEYMSPEQAAGETLDGRSDLYALGVVGFFSLTGQLPFSAPTVQAVLMQHLTKPAPPVSTVARAVPSALARAVDTCLQKNPNDRHATGEALADALAPSLEKRADVPVPIRSFLDRRRIGALIAPIAMSIPLEIQAMVAIAQHGASPMRVGMLIGIAVLGLGIPIALTIARLRKLLRFGYGPDDVAVGANALMERQREIFLFDFGPTRSAREKLFRYGGRAALVAGGGLLTLAAITGDGRRLLPLSMFVLYFGILGTVFGSRWRRLREGKESLWARIWRSAPGRLLGRIASIGVGQRAIPADRATELAIAISAEALYDGLPKELRQSLGDVPEVLRGLEGRARTIRARIAELDSAITEAQREPSRGGASDRQAALVADLRATRATAEAGLSEVVTALENLRLDLLRLHAGAGSPDGITRDLVAARALGEEADRLLAGAREVEQAMKTG